LKKKEPVKPVAAFQNDNFEEEDHLGLKKKSSFVRLMQSQGINIKEKDIIFSDEIIRINSLQSRKVRILVLTQSWLLILVQTKEEEFSIKMGIPMKEIQCIEVPQTSTLLVNIRFKNQ
jgi:hypothetical protein